MVVVVVVKDQICLEVEEPVVIHLIEGVNHRLLAVTHNLVGMLEVYLA